MNNIIIEEYDTEITSLINKEYLRQENNIALIASENYASIAVMKAQGSILTNKYAEGYPEFRYYSGCKYVDLIEKIAINRAKLLFDVDYVNVQPHSGSQANFAVYHALLNPGDIILGMNLKHGGHLTHGSSINFSGKLYKYISYGINEEGSIDYHQLEELAFTYHPKIIIGGFSAYSGTINWFKMRSISDNVGAYFVVDISHIAGLIVAGIYPNPIPYAHVITTTTHKTLSGPRGGLILSKYGDKNLYKKLDLSVFPGSQGGPLMHVIAAKAISFKEALDPNFKIYQIQIIKNSKTMFDVFISRGFQTVSKETINHLFLLNLSNKFITGKEASEKLSLANIIVNKNSIPNDKLNSSITSGIRIGTPAVTKRGLKENDVKIIAHWICDILENINNISLIKIIRKKVLDICKSYPVYNK